MTNINNYILSFSTNAQAKTASASIAQTPSSEEKNLSEIINRFISGNMTVKDLLDNLSKLKCESVNKQVMSNKMIAVSFTYQKKKYCIACNSEAAKSATDNITVTTFSESDLKTKYKFTDEQIKKLFTPVATQEKNVLRYTLNPKYKSINDIYALLNSIENKQSTDANYKPFEGEYTTTETKTSNGKKIVKKYTGGEYIVENYNNAGKMTSAYKYTKDKVKASLDTYSYYNDSSLKTETNVTYESDGTTIKTKTSTTNNTDGTKTVTDYNKDNKPVKKVKYGANGAVMSTTTYDYKSDGSYTVTTKNAKNKPTSVIVYNKDGKKSNQTSKSYYDDGSVKNETVTTFESDGTTIKTKKSTTNNTDGTKTVTDYNKDNKPVKKVKYGANGAVMSTTTYDYKSDGSYTVTTKNAKNKPTSVVSYDKYGNDKKKTEQTSYSYDNNGKTKGITHIKYGSDGTSIIEKVIDKYETDGSHKATTYDSLGKAVSLIKYDKNNNKTGGYKYIYSYNPSTGAVTKKMVNINTNKQVTGKSLISGGTIKNYGVTLSTEKLYDAITQNLDKGLCRPFIFTWTTREVLEFIAGQYTPSFLEAAQTIYNPPKKPKDCDGKVYHVNDEGEYKDWISNKIKTDTTPNYGYEPDQVKGYHFASSSAICQKMAKNRDLTTYVRNNIDNLIAGNCQGKSLSFNSDKDLYYSIHGINVMESKKSGKYLILKLFDIYDFETNNIEKVKTSSSGNGTKFDGIGAAAMADGKLVPYYQVYEVKVDLTQVGLSGSKLKSLGIS